MRRKQNGRRPYRFETGNEFDALFDLNSAVDGSNREQQENIVR